MNEESKILVSICCITYNHAKFVREALEGFLMQEPPTCVPKGTKMSDWCEILIHDDASTDGTDAIVCEYAEKYPELIRPLYETENQYSRGGAGRMAVLFNYKRAKGKYIAYCEGDDYWTDTKKLQKQVDWMESHEEYSVCWHRCKQLIIETGEIKDDDCYKVLQGKDGVEIDLATYFSDWFTQPLTMLFRRSMYDLNWHKQFTYYRDEHELYQLLKRGKGYLFGFYAGMYVRHNGGMFTSMSKSAQYETSLNVSRELWQVNRDEFTKSFYADVLQRLIYIYSRSLLQKWTLSWELYRLDGNAKQFIKNIIRR